MDGFRIEEKDAGLTFAQRWALSVSCFVVWGRIDLMEVMRVSYECIQ